jgi:hypothetical protein
MACPDSSLCRLGRASALALVVATSSPVTLRAAEPTAEPRREGLYVAGSARGFLEQGSYTYDALSAPMEKGASALPLHYVSSLHGPGGGFDFAIGSSIAPGVAIALDVGIAYTAAKNDGALPWTSIDGAYQANIGALVDAFVRDDSGAHFQAGLAFTARGFGWSQAAVGAPDNVVNVESMKGVRARFGGGWSFARAGSLGLDLRFRVDVTRLWSEHSGLTAVAPAIELGVTAF